MKIINKTLKKLSQTMMLSFLLAPIFISSTQNHRPKLFLIYSLFNNDVKS